MSSVQPCCLEIPCFAVFVFINIQGQDAVLSVEMAHPVHAMEKKGQVLVSQIHVFSL